jgi:general secretion pathway protein H
MTSLVTLNLDAGADGRAARQQLQQLSDVAAYALDEAAFSGRDFGLLIQYAPPAGEGELVLRWRERLPQGWRPPARSTDVFTDITLPPGVGMELLLDGGLVTPADAAADAQSGVAPQWLFLASGETQAGELLWRDRDSGELLWRLEWDALGRFTLYRGEQGEAYAARP